MDWEAEDVADYWGEANELARDARAELEARYCPNCGGTEWFELVEGGDAVEICTECGYRWVAP